MMDRFQGGCGRKGGVTAIWAVVLMLGCIGGVKAQMSSPAGQGSQADQQNRFVLEREGRTIVVEPYAGNIVRVTIAKTTEQALAGPGYGVIGKPAARGWSHEKDAEGDDVLRSGRLVVRVSPNKLPASEKLHRMPLDKLNLALRDPYFGSGDGGVRDEDTVTVATSAGKTLVKMQGWSMVPNKGVVSEAKSEGAVKEGPGYRVSATFDAPAAEHYYGLGQQQEGVMDLRDHHVNCWHDYGARPGEVVCVPFLVSTGGYGLVWDNPSKTTVDLGFNERNVWSSEVGDRVSFFVIAGESSDEIYTGYRLLTGVTHMLPKATYGYIQSKAIYPTQEDVLAVAKEYRAKKLPLDVMVVDFLNQTKQGEMDLDPKRWPDPAAMNDQLHAMGVHSLLSVWPHFSEGTQYYDMLLKKGWLIGNAEGVPDVGGFRKIVGPNIDTTNPEAAKWFWETIRDRYIKPDHFDYVWLDETEPDIDPEKDYYWVGSGKRYYNVYPLFHTASVYEGFRRDFGDSRRAMILARAAYLGAQRNGTVFWSSDITATWDMLKRSIPAGLNFTATGMPYWDTDTAGFFSPVLPENYHAAHKPLIDGSDVRENIGPYEDYPELFVRWFEWATFEPVMRTHGERMHNEVWSYGKQAEPILEKYLKLRHTLLPYTYSLGYGSYKTGAPFMRALFMDFPEDANVMDIPDEYMFGPAFLVAPVTEQGATHRKVYLPAGCDWYNYWTNERVKGGQTVDVSAPIDTLPLFVRAGSIVPMGSEIESTDDKQTIAQVRVYPGANGSFTLFADDGTTYAYEKGGGSVTTLKWDDATRKLTHEGVAAWSVPDKAAVKVEGR